MEAVIKVNADLEKLIAECLSSLPSELVAGKGVFSGPDVSLIDLLFERARHGEISTFPYALPAKGTVHWVSFGGDSRGLLEYAEDLRAWILPNYGTSGDLNFARSYSKGRLAKLVHTVSPSGYLRWSSDLKNLTTILRILNQMHALLTSMPNLSSTSPPSVHVLRFRFVSALRCGDWEDAEQVINDIDRWNLEQAHKTMQMRLRLLGESREHAALLDMVERHGLWALSHPTRIAEAIVDAVIHEILQPMVVSQSPDIICQKIRPWYSKLITTLPLVELQESRAPLFAYFACIDDDARTALALLSDLPSDLADFIRKRFDETPLSNEVKAVTSKSNQNTDPVEKVKQEFESTSIEIPNPRQSYWSELQTLVRQGNLTALELHLSELDACLSLNRDLLDAIPDVVIDLISDPNIESSSASRNALHELMTSLVDLIFNLPGFPNKKHIDIYLSVAEALVYLRGDSASEEDAHILHGLLASIANLSTTSLQSCTKLLRAWWQLRPVLPRLNWLLTVLDSLAPLHPHPDEMLDLWVEAVGLAHRKQLTLTPSEYRLWKRVANLLELDENAVAKDLETLQSLAQVQQVDSLANVPWQKIAIISLQESAAREAARELQSRTNAEVIVVTSLVQDGLTKTAKAADLILFVWAASSHAVYRAFDDCRSRLVYVQGTGTSSIIAAAEQRAEKIS